VTTSHAITKRVSRSATHDHSHPQRWHESGLNLDHGQQITGRTIVQATATSTVATALARFARPGWTWL
jgi:hypothetical protein